MIEFDNYDGPYFFPESDARRKWIPINPLPYQSLSYLGCSRTQFPFRLAYGITIHKSQGQTLEKVIIDLGKNEKTSGLSFVALSRVKSYKDFLIKPMALDRLSKIKTSDLLKKRKKEEDRINKLVNDTLKKYNL